MSYKIGEWEIWRNMDTAVVDMLVHLIGYDMKYGDKDPEADREKYGEEWYNAVMTTHKAVREAVADLRSLHTKVLNVRVSNVSAPMDEAMLDNLRKLVDTGEE